MKGIVHGLKNEICYASPLEKTICVVFLVAARVPHDFQEGRGAVCILGACYNAGHQLRYSKSIRKKQRQARREKDNK